MPGEADGQWDEDMTTLMHTLGRDVKSLSAFGGKMPDYKTNDPRGWCGDPKRGAALGRPTIHDAPPDFEGKLCLRRVNMSADGAYDSNGTYFGMGDPIYWYASDCGRIDAVVRALCRSEAREKVLAVYPQAKVRK